MPPQGRDETEEVSSNLPLTEGVMFLRKKEDLEQPQKLREEKPKDQ